MKDYLILPNGNRCDIEPNGYAFTYDELTDYVGGDHYHIELWRGRIMVINSRHKTNRSPENPEATWLARCYSAIPMGDYICGAVAVINLDRYDN